MELIAVRHLALVFHVDSMKSHHPPTHAGQVVGYETSPRSHIEDPEERPLAVALNKELDLLSLGLS